MRENRYVVAVIVGLVIVAVVVSSVVAVRSWIDGNIPHHGTGRPDLLVTTDTARNSSAGRSDK